MDTFGWQLEEVFSGLESREAPSCCDSVRRILADFKDWVFLQMASGQMMGVEFDDFFEWLSENHPGKTDRADEIWGYYRR